MIGPANATRILDAGDAGGSSSGFDSVLPSIISIGAICGIETYAPNGIQQTQYSTPSRVQRKIGGPQPKIENRSTFIPRRRAITKWPYSCAKTVKLKKNTTSNAG